MPISGPCTLKWSDDDPSNAIILTFASRWCEPMVKGKIKVVFRKAGPTRVTPELMYVYFSAPISAIVARLPIVSYEILPLAKAIMLTEDGQISREELVSYARDRQELVVMHVGQVAVASNPITRIHMSSAYNFWPSSTFIPLSGAGKRTLDAYGRFAVKK